MAVIKYKATDGTWKTITNYTVQPITPVQETGASTSAIMSQDAVTRELAKKADADNVVTKLDTVKAFYDFMTGINEVSSVSNIPVDKHFVLATVSADGSMSFDGALAENRELHIIVKNSGAVAITIALTGTLPDGVSALTIEAGKYGEINAINLKGTMYVRAAN